jgi:signal transduction histidine kinase
VECDFDGGDPVAGYRGELRQLFSNLVNNAIEAMPQGGCLKIRITRRPDWSSGCAGVRVTVSDTGSGIDPKDLPHIFEPFYTTKRDIGTGLGLWLSHGIVGKHSGTIRVRSRTRGHHRGTVFSVFLPEEGPAIRAA